MHRPDPIEPHPIECIGNAVVAGVDQICAVGELGQTTSRDVQCIRIAIESYQPEPGKLAQEMFGVSTQPEGGIDVHGTCPARTGSFDGRTEKLHGSIEQYRDVAESVAARLRSVILAVHHVVLRNPARSMRATRAVRS